MASGFGGKSVNMFGSGNFNLALIQKYCENLLNFYFLHWHKSAYFLILHKNSPTRIMQFVLKTSIKLV